MPRRECAAGGRQSSVAPGSWRAALDPVGDRVVVHRIDMAAVALSAGHQRTVTNPQAVAHARAEGAEARRGPAPARLDVEMQAVRAGASLSVLILCRGSNEIGAARSLLNRQEECAVAAAVRHVVLPSLSMAVSARFTFNTRSQSPVQEAFIPPQ